MPADSVPVVARDAILAWYAATGRGLAFRRTTDPYAVLVSELMAQQTQAERAAQAWERWIARWPTAHELAEAPTADVLRAWAGLGYNRRALALHRAAKTIVAEHGGSVPTDVAALAALPGVGPYTARAVAAIAFGQRVGAVDVNVRRALGRIAAGGPEAFTPRSMQVLADAVVPAEAAAWTHALMDIGATLCKPRNPRCDACPAVRWCRYSAGERPAPAAGPPAKRRPAPVFETTTRWLRGRILARARDAANGDWVTYGEAMGIHDAQAVGRAVSAMAEEGLLDYRATADGPEARLPQEGSAMDHDLKRFVEAQAGTHEAVIRELRAGIKTAHWMWFVFPQIAGLGISEMNRFYAIDSLEEAQAYLAHPVLGARLRECAEIVAATRGRSASDIFGAVDARKLHSSMTLFHLAAPEEPAFSNVLARCFGGRLDSGTTNRLPR